jgi:hypothetical protein
MNRPYSNDDKMSPEMSVLILKNAHEIIRVISNQNH